LDIHAYPATLEDGRDHLLATVDRLGLDTAPVTAWYAAACGPGTADVHTRWLGVTVGHLRLEVQGSYQPPVDDSESDRTAVHYVLTW
jgi:hypothetical protein